MDSNSMKKIFLAFNCFLVALGNCGGPLVMRLYFLRGGKRIWLSCWLQTAGWPVMLFPLLLAYNRHRRSSRSSAATAAPFFMKPRLFCHASAIGLLIGIDNYLYASGVAKLPVSTSALIVGTQLVCTSIFAFLLVKQKFTAYTINAVVLLTVGAVVLGLHSNGDKPKGEKKSEYLLGFFITLAAASMYGFLQTLIQLMYLKAKQTVNYTLVLQIQIVTCFFATGLCTVAMLINKDFQAIPREAKAYELGEGKYYLVLIANPVLFQAFFLGVIGVIFYASALLSGIMITVTLPVLEILGVIFYHESFQAEKGVSLFLSLWGFFSYFYGQAKHAAINDHEDDDDDKEKDDGSDREFEGRDKETELPVTNHQIMAAP